MFLFNESLLYDVVVTILKVIVDFLPQSVSFSTHISSSSRCMMEYYS